MFMALFFCCSYKTGIMKKETGNFYFNVAPHVWGMKDIFVNVYIVEDAEEKNWVLIDAGLKTSERKIKRMAASLFGKESKPKCIILTHGHFDHVGSLLNLATEWNVPVYAHYLELPYLTGKSHYPPPDPSVRGGLMAWMSFVYPTKPIDLQSKIFALPEDGSVPYLKEWRYLHTPGHAPGHASLFREEDSVLIAGDAFVTTNQQSAISVMLQTKKLSGPPTYFTYDWDAANTSVKKLLLLAPETIATGHGRPMHGKEMRKQLHNLHEHFKQEAVPSQGRYVKEPAIADANGVLYVPPKEERKNYLPWLISGCVLGFTAVTLMNKQRNKGRWFSGRRTIFPL
jgi:glyoxylase-like metal-dependent hydrolase (beta-lactamase superfamily II)